MQALRTLAGQAFSRAAGAPLIDGNDVRLLEDARENYPAWLMAIRAAKHHVHFESYIIHEDSAGLEFANALIAKAGEGVPVRLIYDWMGGFLKASKAFWSRLREGGVDVRCYNPPKLGAPLSWLSRDHRKTITVDGRVGFVSGLCVGRMWAGEPAKGVPPWRDTGIMIHGPAVAEIERAFAEVWATMGEPIPAAELERGPLLRPVGAVSLRVVATSPAIAGMFRVDQLVAALARERLWLRDAYYVGTTAYVQALCAAAKDGVDVRLLVPNASDIPLLKPLTRAGYRPLLQAGVRIFEWNGPMMHAKTALADGVWSRVGSTNLNISSWFGNYELDVVVEDEPFANTMAKSYLRDLTNATEVVLDARRRTRVPSEPPRVSRPPSNGGSAGRLVAGAVRAGNAMGAAFTDRRVLEPIEARGALIAGALLLIFAVAFVRFPQLLAYPLAAVIAWIALALLYRAYQLRRQHR